MYATVAWVTAQQNRWWRTVHVPLEAGDSILDLVGSLGKPSEIGNLGTAVVVSGGVGTAMTYSTARRLKRAGNKVISIVGA